MSEERQGRSRDKYDFLRTTQEAPSSRLVTVKRVLLQNPRGWAQAEKDSVSLETRRPESKTQSGQVEVKSIPRTDGGCPLDQQAPADGKENREGLGESGLCKATQFIREFVTLRSSPTVMKIDSTSEQSPSLWFCNRYCLEKRGWS